MSYDPKSTVAGRITKTEPEMQYAKAYGKTVQGAVKGAALEPGTYVIDAIDYAELEARLMAEFIFDYDAREVIEGHNRHERRKQRAMTRRRK